MHISAPFPLYSGIVCINELHDVPVMKGRKWYSSQKDLRLFITPTSNCSYVFLADNGDKTFQYFVCVFKTYQCYKDVKNTSEDVI